MTDATDEQAQREAARRALLGDIDSIRKLLELKDSSVAVSTQGSRCWVTSSTRR